MQDEKVIETSLDNLISRVQGLKTSISTFLLKLDHENLSWPQMLDNFAVLSGQISTLNKLLKNERMPVLRNLCVLPILVSLDQDEQLTMATEGRIPIFSHEVVPDALRTKYEPEVEKEEQVLVHQASNITNDDAQRQVSSLGELVNSLLELIQNARDEWEAETSASQASFAPSANDTNILLAAITAGSGLRKRGSSSTDAVKGSPSSRKMKSSSGSKRT